jgi:3D (Asp-Asp-Asp) domain-containing protein
VSQKQCSLTRLNIAVSAAGAVVLSCFICFVPPAIAGVTAVRGVTSVRRPSRQSSMFRVTAYCQRGKTATGTKTGAGVAAADPRLLPMGSVIRINSGRDSETYIIEDRGGRVRGRTIDLYISSCAQARRFGRRQLPVEIVSRGPAD